MYQQLAETQIEDEIPSRIHTVVTRFQDSQFAGERLSVHLTRFVDLFTRLIALLGSHSVAALSDMTMAIDLLDFLTSTSKWWVITRKEPGFILRPPSREPRDFIKSVSELKVGPATLERISAAAERFGGFLDEHDVGTPEERSTLCDNMISCWALLSGFTCKSQGRSVTTEADFETAYDLMRILLFYVPLEDYQALTAVRRIGTSPVLPKIVGVEFSPGFERLLNSSLAANLEKAHSGQLVEMAAATSGASRSLLTNSLRLLAQIRAVERGLSRLGEEHYDAIIVETFEMFKKVGIPLTSLQNESSAGLVFQELRPGSGVAERIQFLVRRLEALIVDSTGNKDFLLQYAKLIPRMVALLLLLASKTRDSTESPIEDIDLKRGLILLHKIINE